jgi:dihydrofolate reductase
MKPYKAIAAMSLNRVIGCDNKIPWHIPEDFKWVKATTLGHIIVMGRKTFESIGRPLPQRENVVITQQNLKIPGVTIIHSLNELEHRKSEKEIWILGGAEIYRQALPRCSDLYLSVIKREVEGDTFFPSFEDTFDLKEILREESDFRIEHYVNSQLQD